MKSKLANLAILKRYREAVVSAKNAITSADVKAFANSKSSNVCAVGAGTAFDLAGTLVSYPNFQSIDADLRMIKVDFATIEDDFRQILSAQRAMLVKE